MITQMVIRELYDIGQEEYRTIAVDRSELLFDGLLQVGDEPDKVDFFFLALGYLDSNYDVDTAQAKLDVYYTN